MTKEDYRKKYKFYDEIINKIRISLLIVMLILMFITKGRDFQSIVVTMSWIIMLIILGITEMFLGYFVFKGEYCEYKMRHSGTRRVYGEKAKRDSYFFVIRGSIVIIFASFLVYAIFYM